MSLLKQQQASVVLDGELVVLKIGNLEIKMEGETAIQVSTWLRVRGKQAKRIAGDTSRHWTVIGNLDAVEAGERPW
jgi:hypothetical protein